MSCRSISSAPSSRHTAGLAWKTSPSGDRRARPSGLSAWDVRKRSPASDHDACRRRRSMTAPTLQSWPSTCIVARTRAASVAARATRVSTPTTHRDIDINIPQPYECPDPGIAGSSAAATTRELAGCSVGPFSGASVAGRVVRPGVARPWGRSRSRDLPLLPLRRRPRRRPRLGWPSLGPVADGQGHRRAARDAGPRSRIHPDDGVGCALGGDHVPRPRGLRPGAPRSPPGAGGRRRRGPCAAATVVSVTGASWGLVEAVAFVGREQRDDHQGQHRSGRPRPPPGSGRKARRPCRSRRCCRRREPGAASAPAW